MKVLITGATGFVGKAITDELRTGEIEIYCLGGLQSESSEGLPNLYKTDITKLESIKSLFALPDIDVLIHSAGLAHQFRNAKEEDFWNVNVVGTENVLELAVKLKVKHFIQISSISVYGHSASLFKPGNFPNREVMTEEAKCQPQSAYARSKLEAEKRASEMCQKNKIVLTILRLATVIGEGDRGNVSRLIKKIDQRRFIWIGAGENVKSLIYKRDVARACRKILSNTTKETEIFNISAEPLKMKEIVSEISVNLNQRIPKISIPILPVIKSLQFLGNFLGIKKAKESLRLIEKWASDEKISNSKIKSAYGFQVRTSIPEALSRQVKSYLNSSR